MLLLTVVDLAERYAAGYVTTAQATPEGRQKPIDLIQLRTILEAVLTGAKEGVYLASTA